MSNMQAIRRWVMDLYSNATWHRKVHNMPDNQVYAIYRKKQEEKERLKQMDIPVVSKEPEPYHQIDIWEYLNDRRA